MVSIPAMEDPGTVDAGGAIYPQATAQATAQASAGTRVEKVATRALTGALFGVLLWLIGGLLGVSRVVVQIGELGGFVCFAGAGAVVILTRLGRALLPASVAAVVLLLVVMYTPVMVGPALALIRPDTMPASADAIVVLSAGVTDDGFLPQQSVDRMIRGLELAKAGVAPVLVLTRELSARSDRIVTSAADQRRFLAVAGAPEVLFTGAVKSTHDEAVAVARLARTRGWKRVVLVTSPFHSRRACATFERAGVAVSCAPSDSRDVAVRTMRSPHDRIGGFAMWLYETAGTLRYRQLGWL